MKKEENNFFYKFFYPLFKALFIIIYRPKINNKNVIPKEGPIVVCGNHIHVLDQMMPIFSTKRMVHYMAKKEYFDTKFAWFFKASGCISVNRSIHDNEAKSKAMDVLRKDLALGIFPEGTRNALASKTDKNKEIYKLYKDELSYNKFVKKLKKNMVKVTQSDILYDLYKNKKITEEEFKNNLFNVDNYLKNSKLITKEEYRKSLMLPIKFGTASMAIKSEATIVPYVLTGKYKMFRKGLKCTFLEPIKTSKKDDIEKITDKLYNMMLDALLN